MRLELGYLARTREDTATLVRECLIPIDLGGRTK